MSIYAVVNGSAPAFFSSNSGWSNVISFAEDKDNELTVLADQGMSENLPELAEAIRDTIELASDDVAATLGELLELVDGTDGDVLVTNGASEG